MLLKTIIFFMAFGSMFMDLSVFAQVSPEASTKREAFIQQEKQLQGQIDQATQSGNQQEAQQLKAQLDALVLEHMQAMNARKQEWLKTHPAADVNQNPSVRNLSTEQRFDLIRARKKAWLEAHPEEAAKQARDEEFAQSQMPLFYELGAAVKSGDTQKVQQLRAQLSANRSRYMQTGQSSQPAPEVQAVPAEAPAAAAQAAGPA